MVNVCFSEMNEKVDKMEENVELLRDTLDVVSQEQESKQIYIPGSF